MADLCRPMPFFWDVHGEEKGSPLQNRLPRCQRTGLRVVSGTRLDGPVASPFVFFAPPWKMKPCAYHLKVLAETFLRRVVLLEQTERTVFIYERFIVTLAVNVCFLEYSHL